MISALVHTYNEEGNIKRCLESLKWVDEVILIDMGSTDKTVEIAKLYKAKVYQHEYTGFVEPARNFGIEKSNGNMILVVDADEEIPITLSHYLIIEAKTPKSDFYRIARKNLIFAKWIKHSGWWPDYQVRFFKKGCVSWNSKIHGIPFTKGIGQDLDAVSELSIIHHNYQNIGQYIERLNRYTNIAAKELFLSNQLFSLEKLIRASSQEFNSRFFIREGYKDGVHGFTLALLQSFSEAVTYFKLWELEKYKDNKVELKNLQKEVNSSFREIQYWFFSEEIKKTSSFLEKVFLKFKRRLKIYG